MASAALTPRVRMMAICDGVRERKIEAGVYHLKGVRQAMTAPAFPFVPDQLRLFVLFSSPRVGEFSSYVRVIHERTDRTIYFWYLDPRPMFNADDEPVARRSPIRCSFPEPGRYIVQVWFYQEIGNDVLKGEMPFIIKTEEV